MIEIPDAPGALARLFADVGEAGVNVEDVAIEHDQNRQVGYLALSVEPEAAAGLAERDDGEGLERPALTAGSTARWSRPGSLTGCLTAVPPLTDPTDRT